MDKHKVDDHETDKQHAVNENKADRDEVGEQKVGNHPLDDSTIREQINAIVEVGMVMYEPFHRQVWNMYRQVGMRYLFKDRTEILFVALAMAVVLVVLFSGMLSPGGSASTVENAREYFYTLVFMLSPIVYFVFVALFFIWKQHQWAAQIEMSTKYNVYQLAALRMLLFSIGALLINTVALAVLSMVAEDFSILFALTMAASSLFIFAALLLRMLLHSPDSWLRPCLFCAGWIVLNGVLIVQNVFSYAHVLHQVPVVVYGVITLVSAYLFYRQVKRLFAFTSAEGVI